MSVSVTAARLWIGWTLALFLTCGQAAAADVARLGPRSEDGKPLGHTYSLSGPIRAGDTERLARLFEADAADPRSAVTALAEARGVIPALIVELDSRGGQPEEAMRLGRWLRGKGGGASVPADHVCASACVLILAGAILRSTPGAVAVHRAYLESAPPGEAGNAWLALDRSIRLYLAEMNVPPGLADLALEVPPEDVRVLTPDEKRRFLLEGWDPAAEEERISVLARLYGLTSGEFRRRFEETQRACGSEGLIRRRIFTLDLNSNGGSRSERIWDDWYACRWKAMGSFVGQGSRRAVDDRE